MQTIQVTTKENYRILQLNRGKVNAINQVMIDELRQAIAAAEQDEGVGGMILTGIPRFFSAGLDVKEIYDYNREEIRAFFTSFFALHRDLVKFTKPLICAINGYSPAGGTVLAIAADYRIMVDGEQYVIGLNEMAVNIQISQTLVNAYAFWLGASKANAFLLNGKLLHTQEALSSGLVNELVVNEEDLMVRGEAQMQRYLAADPEIFANTKRKIRNYWLAELEAGGEEELEEALRIWWKPSVRDRMQAFVASLSKK